MPSAIRSERVLLGEGESQRIVPATLELAEGRIAAIHEGEFRPPPDGELEDLGERLVTPAFVNAHTHLALAALRGRAVEDAAGGNRVEADFFAIERRMSAEDVRAFARVGAYESLLCGVGLVWDHYYFSGAVTEALAEVGVCGVLASTLQDLEGPGVAHFDTAWEETLALHGDAGRRAQGIYAALGPHATDTVSGEAWTRIAAAAERHGLPVHSHVAQSPEEVERVVAREGVEPLTWLSRLGLFDRAPSTLNVHAIFASLESMAGLDPARHHLVFCPRAQSLFAMRARVDAWIREGRSWFVGSDAAASNDAMDPRAELAWVASVRSEAASHGSALSDLLAKPSLSPAQRASCARQAWTGRSEGWAALESACAPRQLLTRVWGAPGAAHPDFVAGRIEVGALANLIAWDFDHPNAWPATDPLHTLVYADVKPCIWNLMTLGQWRGQGGDFARSVLATDGWRAARVEADARLAALLA